MKASDIRAYNIISEYTCVKCFRHIVIGFSHIGTSINSILLALTDKKCICGQQYLVKHAQYDTRDNP